MELNKLTELMRHEFHNLAIMNLLLLPDSH